jgi:hypothetical protein
MPVVSAMQEAVGRKISVSGIQSKKLRPYLKK